MVISFDYLFIKKNFLVAAHVSDLSVIHIIVGYIVAFCYLLGAVERLVLVLLNLNHRFAQAKFYQAINNTVKKFFCFHCLVFLPDSDDGKLRI